MRRKSQAEQNAQHDAEQHPEIKVVMEGFGFHNGIDIDEGNISQRFGISVFLGATAAEVERPQGALLRMQLSGLGSLPADAVHGPLYPRSGGRVREGGLL